MNKLTRWLAVAATALLGFGGAAQAAPTVTLAIGGAGCLCYLPTVLAKQLGMYKQAGLDVNMVNFKGGSQALTAVIGGSADVVSGYFDHTVELAAKHQKLESFVIYDRFPGLVLVVSPKETDKITSIKDLAGKHVGVSAPGSSTDFFLKYLLTRAGLKRDSAAVIGVGLGGTAIAAMEQGRIDAAVMLDPAVTILQNKYKNLRILSDTRSEKDTVATFGGNYPGGAFYARASWVNSHKKEAQMMTDAMVNTLKWIHSHTPEQIMAKMPPEMVGKNKKTYLAALTNTIPMYSKDGMMDPKGAEAVLKVFSEGDPEVAKAHVNITDTYTNEFAKKANKM
ncbi:ABC transporter substrate-binding protein [Defluviimonas sp. 20V17]|uniref:ABC transporter substrate-binding protein n=1 Tax=Allgaiera indica TaxID=765699 RepID=A0AAN4ZZY8_9RHOB|nr:ABC transporter substrate-binding protein [Allgaiera indica]KDB02009.1 ABC transporter substrate-binding protein [Defluviimonas sp. 20V17]GHE03283.1 ABC transporter substrate-binding protein [Allgaiera indica]SDX22784.1 NitT/TauT family transport system substrate-binding protein [Allgaiera indica]